MTLGGLLALGYTVVVSYKRASTTVNNGKVTISYETIDVLGGPSGSGKTSLAHKMANIIGCEVVSLESYYKQVKDFKYDDFNALDLSLVSKEINGIKRGNSL